MKKIAHPMLALLLAVPAAPSTTRAQNLLSNGDFAVDLAGWQFPDAMPVWSSFDIAGSATSGSALGTNNASDATIQVNVLSQCIPIAKAGIYVFGTSAFLPSGQVDGYVTGSFGVSATANCTSYTQNGGFFVTSIAQWQTRTSGSHLNVPSPLSPQASILVSLGMRKTSAGGSLSAYFDNVFLVYDPIFADGLE